jgi:very-short-patch-repair endonuclease
VSAVVKRPQAKSYLEEILAIELRSKHVPGFCREFVFHDTRDWRFDFAWPEYRFAVEVDGYGRHQSKSGFEKDCEKLNEAAMCGWTVLRFTGAMVRDARAAKTIAGYLAAKHAR